MPAAPSAPEPVSHPGCWDRYVIYDDLAPGLHGPDFLDAVTVESYDQIDLGTARRLLDEWLDESDPLLPSEIRGDLPKVRSLLDAADVVLHLRDLGAELHHDRPVGSVDLTALASRGRLRTHSGTGGFGSIRAVPSIIASAGVNS